MAKKVFELEWLFWCLKLFRETGLNDCIDLLEGDKPFEALCVITLTSNGDGTDEVDALR